MREDKVKEVRRQRTSLSETTSLRKKGKGFACVTNAERRRAVERKNSVDKQRRNTKKAKRRLDGRKGDRIKSLRPIKDEDMQ